MPDALAAALGRGGADGKLVIIKKGGDAGCKCRIGGGARVRVGREPLLYREGVACDAVGCNARLTDRSLIALTIGPEAFAEDCRAALVVSSRSPRAIDRSARMRSGALALHRVGNV